jgi:hypothetical protein
MTQSQSPPHGAGSKTTYDLANKENSAKLGDGSYAWRNSTLLLTEGHSQAGSAGRGCSL